MDMPHKHHSILKQLGTFDSRE